MADRSKQKQEMQELKSQIGLVLEKLTGLDTKMDNISKQNDERLGKVEGRVFEVEKRQDVQEAAFNELERNQNLASEMLTGLEHEVKFTTDKAINNEQYQRNFNIRIFNLYEKEAETIEECENKVLELFNSRLGVKVKLEDIDILHRLGPKRKTVSKQNDGVSVEKEITKTEGDESMEVAPNESGNSIANGVNESEAQSNQGEKESEHVEDNHYSRPVIVSFLARRIRRMVLSNRSKLKKTPGQTTKPVIITEDLTKWHHALLSKARDSEKYNGGVWPKDGKIFAKHDGRIIRIRGFADVIGGPGQQFVFSGAQMGSGAYRGAYRGPRSGRGRGRRGGFRGPHNQLFRGNPSYSLRASPFVDRGLINLQNKYDPLVIDNDSTAVENHVGGD